MNEVLRLFQMTHKWSSDRGIIANSTLQAQGLKLVSEVGELNRNIAKGNNCDDDIGDCCVVLANLAAMANIDSMMLIEEVESISIPAYAETILQEFVGEVGILCDKIIKREQIFPSLVYCFYSLGIVTQVHSGISITDCWQLAYDDIKDRKGFLNKDGAFIKESDPAYAEAYAEFLEERNA